MNLPPTPELPNYPPHVPDPKPVYYCDSCGEGIFDGDEYVEFFDNRICKACMDKNRKYASALLEDW